MQPLKSLAASECKLKINWSKIKMNRPLSFHGPAGINNVRFRSCSVKDSVYDDKFSNIRYHTVAVSSTDGRLPTEGDEDGRPPSAGAAAAAATSPRATGAKAG